MSNTTENASIFDRLHRKASPASDLNSSPRTDRKRAKQPLRFKSSINSEFINRLRRPNEASSRQRAGGNKSQSNIVRGKTSTKSNNHSNWKLTCIMKCKGRCAQKPTTLNPVALKISQHMESLERGVGDEQLIAHAIITALFDRDFNDGRRSRRWEICASTVSREASGSKCKYVSKKRARYDWKGVFSIASASAIIHFNTDQRSLVVEEYSFCVACRRFTF